MLTLKKICLIFITSVSFIFTFVSCATRSGNGLYEPEYYSPLQRENIINMSKETILINYRKYFKNWEGENLLILAIRSQELDLVPMLIANGVDVDAQDKFGYTPLMHASYLDKNRKIVVQLVEAGATLDSQNNEGETALMIACRYNKSKKIIQYYIEQQADFNIQNVRGESAWDILKENPYLSNTPLGNILASTPEQQLIELAIASDLRQSQRLQYGAKNSALLYKRGTTTLMWAAKYNASPENTINDLAKITDIHKIDDDGNNVVHYALENIHSNKAKEIAFLTLNDLDVDMDVANNSQKTPFIIALENNANKSVLKTLIAQQEVKSNDANISQALFSAAQFTTYPSVHQQLILEGSSPIQRDQKSGKSPLSFLALGVNKDKAELYRLYINNGADITMVDNQYNTPIHDIVRYTSRKKIVKLVTGKRLMGGKPDATIATLQANEDGQNALHMAARYNDHLSITKKLVRLSRSELLSAKDRYNKLPVHYAAKYNENPNIIKFLLKKNKQSMYMLGENDVTLLMEAAQNIENKKAVRIVLRKATEEMINHKDNAGNTALHYAAQYAKYAAPVKDLLRAGADVNAQNALGQTPIMLAMMNTETPDVAKELLASEEIDLNIVDNNGWLPIKYAIEYTQFVESARALFGADTTNWYSYKEQDGRNIDELILENKYLAPYFEINKQ